MVEYEYQADDENYDDENSGTLTQADKNKGSFQENAEDPYKDFCPSLREGDYDSE